MTGKPRLWPVLLAAAAGLLVLMALGVWQLQRLAWKEDLLARLAANLTAPPLGLAEAETRLSTGETITFRKVMVTGRFLHAGELHLISVYEGGPGWTIVTPLLTAEGRAVLVDRGVAPDAALERLERPTGEVTVIGLVRDDVRRKGIFVPENDAAANRWYWWDRPAMATAAGLEAAAAARFILQVMPSGPPAAFPRPLPPEFGLRNNHLGYAITWFGLAAVLVAMTVAYLRAQRRQPSA